MMQREPGYPLPYASCGNILQNYWYNVTTKIFTFVHSHRVVPSPQDPSWYPFIDTHTSLPSFMSGNHLSVLYFFFFVISRMLYKWNHPVCNFSSSIILWRFIQVVTCINCWFFFITESVFHDMDGPVCLTIHIMADIRVVSNSWLSWVKLLWTFVYRCFVTMFSFFWDRCPGV